VVVVVVVVVVLTEFCFFLPHLFPVSFWSSLLQFCCVLVRVVVRLFVVVSEAVLLVEGLQS